MFLLNGGSGMCEWNEGKIIGWNPSLKMSIIMRSRRRDLSWLPPWEASSYGMKRGPVHSNKRSLYRKEAWRWHWNRFVTWSREKNWVTMRRLWNDDKREQKSLRPLHVMIKVKLLCTFETYMRDWERKGSQLCYIPIKFPFSTLCTEPHIPPLLFPVHSLDCTGY